MVDRPGQLDAVVGYLPRGVHGAGVVDENVHARIAAPAPRRQLRTAACDARSAMSVPTVAPCLRAALDPRRRNAASGLVAADDGDVRPEATSASAAARPMPLVAPVIRICLPFMGRPGADHGPSIPRNSTDCQIVARR